jgi:hypothetical protein
MISHAERQIAQLQAEASRQAEQTKREAADLLHAAQEKLVSTESLLREQQDEAERARAAIHEEADRYAQKAYEQADAHVDAAANRAADLAAEAEAMIASARKTADAESQGARIYSERLIGQATARSNAITRDTEELLLLMTTDAETQMSDLRRQQAGLSQYVQRMRTLGTEPDVVSMDALSYNPPTAPTPLVISA